MPAAPKLVNIVMVGNQPEYEVSLRHGYDISKLFQRHGKTCFENYTVNVEIDGSRYSCAVWETAEMTFHDKQRRLSYLNIDVLIAVFAADSASDRFETTIKFYIAEVRQFCPNIPVLLVGNRKSEPRQQFYFRMPEKRQYVTPHVGEELARELNAIKYLECSSETGRGVRNVFYEAVWATLGSSSSKHAALNQPYRSCSLT